MKRTIKLMLFALVLLLHTRCSISKYAYRNHQNRVKQDEIQYEHSIPANQDWTRAYRNWWNRPQKDPFLIRLVTNN